ncbi:hypothetical protein ACF3NF_05840 [Anaerococcus martiniensis]|uniref:hypothetical protein n=1 Tax=Anaerococcus sp. WGS1579 TaxID=3366809 RepID=UPI00372D0FB4
MKGKTITKYTSLALALALVLPTTAKAAEGTNTENTIATTIEQTNNEVREDIKSELSSKLDESGKTVNYTLNITNAKEDEDLKAVFYILDRSNLESLEVLEDEDISNQAVKTEGFDGGKKITVDLKNARTISLRANIKEGKTNNFVFDYILANDSISTIKRVASALAKDTEGKDILKEEEINEVSSTLAGKFIDQTKIEWSDFLVNPTDKDIIRNYDLSLSENQKNPGKITIETFKAAKDGFVKENTIDLDFGNIQNLNLPANGLVKISFQSDVSSEDNTFSLNGVELKRDAENTDLKNQIDDLSKTIQENDKEIKDELRTIDNNYIAKSSGNIETNAKTQSSDQTNPQSLAQDIEQRNKHILEQMRKIDKSQEAQSVQDSNKQASQKDVKVISLKDDASNSSTNISQIDVDNLRIDIEDRNTEIINTLKEIDKEYPTIVTLANKQTYVDQDKNITDLIKEIDDRNQAIQDELQRIYGKYAVNTVMDLNKSIDDDTYELLTQVDTNNEKVSQIIDQVNLSIEANQALESEEELAKIKALLDNIEKLEKNNEKVLANVDGSKQNQESGEKFKKVVPGYSENVYKDLEKVVTITLDPLSKVENTATKESASKAYPTLAKYLEDLEFVKAILK